jgi:(p)ppGpp synthase/HD superfamily hydrolase
MIPFSIVNTLMVLMDYSKNFIYSDRLIEKLKITDTHYQLNFYQINKAIYWAKKYHDGQFRKSGEPFYSHPLEVAYMVSDYNLKTDVIIVAILHDIVEDTEVTAGMILDTFGWRIAGMVDLLTRDRPDGSKISVEQILKNAWEKNDKEVILIKIIDRIHNISTLAALSKEKQKKQLTETIKNFLIFAEELSLDEVSDFIYKKCITLNTELGIISQSDIETRKNIFNENFTLPFLVFQNV